MERFRARGFNGLRLLLFRVLCDSLIGPTVSFHQPLHLHEPRRAALDRFVCCDGNFHEYDCIDQAAPLGSGPICERIPTRRHNYNNNQHVRTVREVPVALWFGGCGGHFMRPSSLDWQKINKWNTVQGFAVRCNFKGSMFYAFSHLVFFFFNYGLKWDNVARLNIRIQVSRNQHIESSASSKLKTNALSDPSRGNCHQLGGFSLWHHKGLVYGTYFLRRSKGSLLVANMPNNAS